MAAWKLLGARPVLAPGEERLTPVHRAGTRREGWVWLGGPRAGAARAAGTEPGSEMRADHRVWGTKQDAERRCHLGLLDDNGEITGP